MTKLLFREKNYVSRNMTKRDLHTIRCRPQFLRMCVETEKNDEKSSLNSLKNRILWRTHFAKRFFTKCSQIWRITLYTLFAFRTNFISSFLFRHYSRIVCSGLKLIHWLLNRNYMIWWSNNIYIFTLFNCFTSHIIFVHEVLYWWGEYNSFAPLQL